MDVIGHKDYSHVTISLNDESGYVCQLLREKCSTYKVLHVLYPMQRRSAKSFVDDLVLSRGVVLSRAAASRFHIISISSVCLLNANKLKSAIEEQVAVT